MMYVDALKTSFCRVLPVTLARAPGQPSAPPQPQPRRPHRHRSLPRASLCLVLLLFSGWLSPVVSELMPATLYPFNLDAGDMATDNSDDGGSGKIPLIQEFPFFGERHSKLYVNNNGVISFLQNLRGYRPEDFPLEQEDGPIMAPYWADVDVYRVGGTVWYRQTQNPDILSRAEAEVYTFSSAYRNFRARWAFIATWDNVGFYGADDIGKTKLNTFQCVLVTDGDLSFVIFIYHKLQWTTGSNSLGGSSTGLGGNPAQAGFNAGDGIHYYELEGAGTNSVINLTHTSNVCIPGRWIFRVDLGARIISSDPEKVSLTPSSGSMLGGYPVAITGPCFQGTSSVQGHIAETNMTFPCGRNSSEVGSRSVYCVMPTMFRVGPVTVSIVVDGVFWTESAVFTLVNAGVSEGNVIRHAPESWRAGESSVRVSWRSLFPTDSEEVVVDIMSYRDEEGEPLLVTEQTDVIPRPDDNNNMVTLKLPPLRAATLAVIRVKVPYVLINGSYLSYWSDIFPVRWSSPEKSDNWCSDWLAQEASRSRLTQQAACPCTMAQAESDTGRWQKDPLCSSKSSSPSNCIYRGSSAHECIVPTYKGPQTVNQRCCYGSNKELLDVREGGGGSLMERYHFRWRGEQIVPWFSYLLEDVAPFLHCCDYSTNATLCQQYSQMRPLVSCQGYKPPAAAQAAGDPHMVTLDGVNYTFNGEGDFVLLRDDSNRIRVQVKASRAVNIDGQLGNATLFTAVAMAVVNETEVLEIRKDGERVIVYVDKEELDLTTTPVELTGITLYRNETDNGTTEFVVVMDTAGISVLVSATPDLLNIMVLVGSPSLRGKLLGLLGNYNGIKEDDFKPPHGPPIPITSSMSDIHNLFGMKWRLERNESLLYYPETAEQEAENAAESNFTPVYMDSLNNEDLRNGTLELCQGNLQCIFDFQLTGKKSIGESTKQFNDRFETVVKEIAPVVRCPYVQQIDNGNRTLEGQAVGQRVFFTCDDGFSLTNSTTSLLCLDSGSWSGTAPDCNKAPQEETDYLLYYLGVGGGVGAVVFLVICVLVVRAIVLRCRKKYIPKRSVETGSEPEQFELPTCSLFHPSATPNPVFQNPLFLSSLQNLKTDEGRFQIPRPRYVDPNIYTEYF